MALIGAHISAAGGIHKAFARADALSCESMQIFTRNQRQWLSKELAFSEIEDFYRASKESTVKSVVSHASYLINLAGECDIRQKSEEALVAEIKRCHALSIPRVVLHPGFSGNYTADTALKMVSESLLRVFEMTSDTQVSVLLETMAGQGSVVGSEFGHLAVILDLVSDHPRLGFCIDMCHIFAASYEIRSYESYNRIVSLLSKQIGLDNIGCWHLSDSKMGRGSKKDRHAHLGQGEIGLNPFAMLVSDRRFENIPAILETPKDGGGDKENLSILRKLRGYK